MPHVRWNSWVCGVLASLSLGAARGFALGAQIVLPNLSDTGLVVRHDGTPVTLPAPPALATFAVERYRAEQAHLRAADVSTDSVNRLVASYAARWLDRYPDATGIERIPVALLALDAGDDTVARRQMAAWLRTPQLSLGDRIVATMTLLHAFADPTHPARLAVAESALVTLEEIVPNDIALQMRGHRALVDAYYRMGASDAVQRHATRMLALALAIPAYRDRMQWLARVPLELLAQVYAGLPDGPDRIARLGATVRAATALMPKDRASLPALYLTYGAPAQQHTMDVRVRQLSLWGQPSPPILAHVWINDLRDTTLSPTPASWTLADGMIHVLELGDATCLACLAALPDMERLARRMDPRDSVSVAFVTQTVGRWGVDTVPADVEIAHLKAYYVGEQHVTMPIAVWAGPKLATPEGGSLPAPSPNDSTFNRSNPNVPMFVVTDRMGRIRYMSTRYSHDLDMAQQLQSVVAFLRHERTDTASPPAGTASRPPLGVLRP